jgi:dipeptidyl aminopeptidase/acylaminoacyl peptidase
LPARVPLEAFFRAPAIGKPALSPDGRHLAVIVDTPSGHEQLAIIDLEALGPPKVIAGLEDVGVASHDWVNDERLVFDTPERQTSSGRWLAPGLWAVNRDGTMLRRLVDPVVSTAAGARRSPAAARSHGCGDCTASWMTARTTCSYRDSRSPTTAMLSTRGWPASTR